MKSLYDVQEWLKKYGYINLMSDRKDAIYFMQQEVMELHKRGILESDNSDFLTASLILKREMRIENGKQKRE